MLKNVYTFGLSVCSSACARSNSSKYSSDILKFIHVAHIRYKMDRFENGMYGIRVRLQTRTKVFRYITAYEEGKFLKLILTINFALNVRKLAYSRFQKYSYTYDFH